MNSRSEQGSGAARAAAMLLAGAACVWLGCGDDPAAAGADAVTAADADEGTDTEGQPDGGGDSAESGALLPVPNILNCSAQAADNGMTPDEWCEHVVGKGSNCQSESDSCTYDRGSSGGTSSGGAGHCESPDPCGAGPNPAEPPI